MFKIMAGREFLSHTHNIWQIRYLFLRLFFILHAYKTKRCRNRMQLAHESSLLPSHSESMFPRKFKTRRLLSSRVSFATAMVSGLTISFLLCYTFAPPDISEQEYFFNSLFESRSRSASLTVQEILKGPLSQNDSRLLSYILSNNVLRPPSTKEYKLDRPEVGDPSVGQSKAVRKILNEQRNGFFVECGGLDGEELSNTLYLEKELGWQGILIEPGPNNYDKLVKRQRKAWSARVCLSTFPYPHQVLFREDRGIGKIVPSTRKSRWNVIVQCYPLFTLLSALNVSVVDYFSLDVEGVELDVLKTIPFDSIFIKVVTVEYKHVPGGMKAVEEFMLDKGFNASQVIYDDILFINKKLL